MLDLISVVRYEQTDASNEKSDSYRYLVVEEWCEENLAPLLTGLNLNEQTVSSEDFARTGNLVIMLPAQETQAALAIALLPASNVVRGTPGELYRYQVELVYHKCSD